jgi:colicin import membrane protein
MKTGVTTSVVAHAALLIVAIMGLGSAKPLEPEVVESIAVDLVPISDITNIRQGSLESTVVKTETPAVVKTETPAQLAQKAGNTEEDQPKPEETAKSTPAPVVNTAPKPVEAPQPKPEPDPVKEPVPTPQPVAEPDPAPSPDDAEPQQEVATDTATDAPAAQVAPMPALRPAQLQKAPPKPVVKTAEVTPKKTETPKKQTEQSKDKPQEQAKIADQVAELINSEKSRGATTGQGGDPTLGKTTGKSATLTQSQLDGLVAQIKQCMSVPPGAAEAGITAQLHFSLDGQGNVTGTPDIVNAAQSQLERALASAAQRAVMRCGPYAMAPNQEVQATFDPRELT